MTRLLQMLGICLAVLLLNSCYDKSKYVPEPYLRPLEIIKLSEQDYMHVSYLKDDNGGYIPCNGFMRKEGTEVFVFETPIDSTSSEQLISYIQEHLKATVKGVFVGHSHSDAAGGVPAFTRANIPTYASSKTTALLQKDTVTISHPFTRKDSVQMGTTEIVMEYFGAAHTDDNSVAYLKGPEILVGGCMIKALGAKRGYLGDASLSTWSTTVSAVKNAYPKVQLVIPGHGRRGDSLLLDYTIKMFKEEVPENLTTQEQAL